jgi:Tol biopolymer transport system component
MSADGRYVTFVSWATNLVADDTNNFADVFVKDMLTGVVTRVSVSTTGGDANAASYAPAISADGRYVAFVSDASNLVVGDTNNEADVFVRDVLQGATSRVSVSSNGAQSNGASNNPVVSSDGRYVAFDSLASNLVADDNNSASDVFVRDLVGGTTERVSLAANGAEGSAASEMPSISSDGRYVAFASAAENLIGVAGDTNQAWDVFVRDRTAATTVRVSITTAGSQASGNSFAPAISGDGRYVAFESQASDLCGVTLIPSALTVGTGGRLVFS